MSDAIDREVSRLKAFVAENALSLAEIARRSGLNYTTVRDALKDGVNPRVDTLKAIIAIVPDDFVPQSEVVQ